ncbi:MAG TPA: NAD(P)/FAD-dependent oxidoreductase [Paucimonas sp.]|nr:NAD(P)/FAD-dependent oxidoreductase [Paucimonas sp.]
MREARGTSKRDITVAIIGAGFGGLGMAYHLKRAGIDTFTILEKAAVLGGVWRDNTYPGAACDIPSHLYSYSFEPDYPWSRRYARQDEILAYLRHVARKHDLERHIEFGQEAVRAEFDAARGLWTVAFADGSVREADVLITAVGQLQRPVYPEIAGLDAFQGRAFHSARWDHGFDFREKTAAVIGTGASAIQFVPEIAGVAKQLYVFQRSPGWVLPKPDRRFLCWERALFRSLPALRTLDRLRDFVTLEFFGASLLKDALLRRPAQAVAKAKFRRLLERQVADPELRAKLTPAYSLGCKRTLLSNDWLATLARPDVEVVTEPIREVGPETVVTADGRARRVDAIIYGTGFAATEFLVPMKIRGLGGVSLHERWREKHAHAYLGMCISGFPNFFMLYGPNTNLGAGSIVYMLERQSRYVAQCLARLRELPGRYMTVRPEAEAAFDDWVTIRNAQLPYESGCRNWYLDAGGRNTSNWGGYMSEYGRVTRVWREEHFEFVRHGITTGNESVADP